MVSAAVPRDERLARRWGGAEGRCEQELGELNSDATRRDEALKCEQEKKLTEECAVLQSKRLRNKVAGFATHLMKRIQKGPVRGISLKLQEEERERRMDFVPDVSAVDTDVIEVDPETKAMLRSLDMAQLTGIVVQQASSGGWNSGKGEGKGGGRR